MRALATHRDNRSHRSRIYPQVNLCGHASLENANSHVRRLQARGRDFSQKLSLQELSFPLRRELV